VDGGKTLPDIIDRANTTARLLTGRGYDHDANRQVLAECGLKDGIARKAKPGKKLGERAQARKKAVNRTRARVEHVSGQLRHMGGLVVRAVTLARNELAIALKCAVYNARRLGHARPSRRGARVMGRQRAAAPPNGAAARIAALAQPIRSRCWPCRMVRNGAFNVIKASVRPVQLA
jgi:hypothetical protein